MTELTLQNHRRTMWHFIPGLALSAVITGVALWGGAIPAVAGAGFSALTLAILLGMVIGNTVYPQIWKQCDGGVLFAKQHLLRLGIILYGFRLTFSQIADVGISGIVIDVLTLSSTFMLACFLGQKVFGLDRHTSWLIGAGSSICGAAAVLATEPVVKAEANKVTVAVATVVIFGTIAIFLYPAMYPLLAHWFSPETYGIYIGSTMHEVAQVAAGMVPPLALGLATIVARRKFDKAQQEGGKAALVLGLCFITEGAIPFAARDPMRVLPCCIVGGALTGAISMAVGAKLMAPHGGLFVLLIPGAITPVLGYLLAIVAGTLVAGLAYAVLKRPETEVTAKAA